jgi:hypothetical protein
MALAKTLSGGLKRRRMMLSLDEPSATSGI